MKPDLTTFFWPKTVHWLTYKANKDSLMAFRGGFWKSWYGNICLDCIRAYWHISFKCYSMADTEKNQTFGQINLIILHSMKTLFQRSIQSLSWLKGFVSWWQIVSSILGYISECNGLSKNRKKNSKLILIKHYQVKILTFIWFDITIIEKGKTPVNIQIRIQDHLAQIIITDIQYYLENKSRRVNIALLRENKTRWILLFD